MAGSPDTILIAPVARLIEEFSRLPGVGPKTASRLTFFLLRAPDDRAQALSEALAALKQHVRFCSRCFFIAEGELCTICSNPARDQRMICVVEEPLDVVAIERTAIYKGLYHVLHGRIAPLEGMNREDIYFDELIDRVRADPVEEVILATNPNLEGEATAFHMQRSLVPLGVRVTRLARGLPTGGDLEWADPGTLGSALEGRREL
ncbi:MAG TPA: recombination mediator RecR [Roseiflexaceae bacterium]|nr:recombination mediator RecR [Roseiflexaceae bacterium]HMP42138.1 recombination mediator RecR [Roseiflexaceae bacterium]